MRKRPEDLNIVLCLMLMPNRGLQASPHAGNRGSCAEAYPSHVDRNTQFICLLSLIFDGLAGRYNIYGASKGKNRPHKSVTLTRCAHDHSYHLAHTHTIFSGCLIDLPLGSFLRRHNASNTAGGTKGAKG